MYGMKSARVIMPHYMKDGQGEDEPEGVPCLGLLVVAGVSLLSPTYT